MMRWIAMLTMVEITYRYNPHFFQNHIAIADIKVATDIKIRLTSIIGLDGAYCCFKKSNTKYVAKAPWIMMNINKMDNQAPLSLF